MELLAAHSLPSPGWALLLSPGCPKQRQQSLLPSPGSTLLAGAHTGCNLAWHSGMGRNHLG